MMYSKCDIDNMCRKLQPKETLRLLCVIVEKMKTRRSSWNKLLSWFPSLLVYHTGYLMANSNVISHLIEISKLMEAHQTIYQPLLALFGRVDLVMKQNNARGEKLEERKIPIVRTRT